MSLSEPRQQSTTLWWITSLAISITCCSVLFVIFAGYIFDMKESQTALRIRAETTDQRLNAILDEMDNLRRRSNVQQIQIMPAPGGGPLQLPISVLPQQTPESAPPLPTPAASTPVAKPPDAPAKKH